MPEEINEIGKTGKAIAGILLILFTILPLIAMIGFWPDQMPEPKSPLQFYSGKFFHFRLSEKGLHINTIMFLLVALAGFMGSMIHLGSSFTNFVGSGKFKQSWILWYFVKPFTASGVAVLFFLVLKAGLLNFDGAGAANPFGIVILSALAGLFTDKATLKLEEIFTVIFKPKDERPGKMDDLLVKIKDFEPKKLTTTGENSIKITGEGFDKSAVVIKINEVAITDTQVAPDNIQFKYTVPDASKTATELPLSISDANGKFLFTGVFQIGNSGGPSAQSSSNGNGVQQEDEVTADALDFVKG